MTAKASSSGPKTTPVAAVSTAGVRWVRVGGGRVGVMAPSMAPLSTRRGRLCLRPGDQRRWRQVAVRADRHLVVRIVLLRARALLADTAPAAQPAVPGPVAVEPLGSRSV